MLEEPELPIPVYARREVFKAFIKYKGLAPCTSNAPLRLSEVTSITEYFKGIVLRHSLSGFRLYGALSAALNFNATIGENRLINWDNDWETKTIEGFIHQRRPVDKNNRTFTKGA